MPTKFRMIKCLFQNYIVGNNNTVVYLKKKSKHKCLLSQTKIRNSLGFRIFYSIGDSKFQNFILLHNNIF